MESFAVLVILALLGLLVIWPIWVVSNVLRLRRQTQNDWQESLQHWRDLTARVFLLETHLKELKETLAAGEASRESVPAPKTEPAPPVAEQTAFAATSPLPQEVNLSKPRTVEPVPSTEAPRTIPPVAVPPSPLSQPQSAAPTSHPQSSEPLAASKVPQAPRPAIPTPHPPATPPSSPMSPTQQPRRPATSGLDLEEVLGTNWLNKIGIGILVLGLAFFLAYQLQNLGPGGKVLLGVALSAVMIAVGVRFDSNERYRILARASAAGGWALLYFVSYAIYHVPAAKIIDSRELDFLLMLLVAAAIIRYSLRYRSEATTALALVLSYLTVGIHNTSPYSVLASVVLAFTVVALALRMQWYALELFGILATYFNHLLWVIPLMQPFAAFRPNHVTFPEFNISVGLLAFYWLLFRLSYVFRQVNTEAQERLSTASALANGFCLLALLRYQSAHPEWAFRSLLALGAVELALSAVAARRRRAAFVVLATLGSVLLVAAIPFRYSGSDLSVLWLMAAEALLLAGVFLSEVVFRRIGMITLVVLAAQMVFDTGARLIEIRLTSLPGILPDYPAAVLFGTAAALFYFNSHWLPARWPKLFENDFDSSLSAALSYLGGLLLLLATWFAVPGMWTAVVWATLVLLLDLAAQKFAQPSLAIQGNLIAAAAVVRLITLNMSSPEHWHGLSLRLVTVGATALLLYAAAPFARGADHGQPGVWSAFTQAYTWVASVLLGVLLWIELPALDVALAWMAMGILLVEIGLQLRADFLRWQGYAALAASFPMLFAVNLDLLNPFSPARPHLSTVLPLVAGYYYMDWRLRRSSMPNLLRHATVFAYGGTIALAAFLYFEVMPSWVAAAWAGLAIILLAASWGQRRRDLLHQSFLMVGAVAFRVLTYNFLAPRNPYLPFFASQQYYAGVAVALLFAGLPIAFALRKSGFQSQFSPDNRPEQVFFFVPFALLTALIGWEASRGQLTLSWGIEGVVVFLFAVLVGERSFRLAGVGLLLLCVVKIFLIDVWGLDPQSRYITLIVLGGALLLVSFLYTRHKEKFQRYL
jgi:uncharacterized membrane protein